MKKKTTGAFGGLYNREVIKELRQELAKSRIMVTALCQHTGTTEAELLNICSTFNSLFSRDFSAVFPFSYGT